MTLDDLKQLELPDEPGVYRFLGNKGEILYLGKATSLRDRVRSYFSNDLLKTRGKHILDMVLLAKTVKTETTGSAIEALILEASLIKKFQPPYNTKEKDNKSFNYAVITQEEFPRVLVVRERTMLVGGSDQTKLYRYVFGPFTSGRSLQEALKIIRKVLPFRDTCTPNQGKPCFNAQIGLCPGVCKGAISSQNYAKMIQHIRLFLEGKKGQVIKQLTKEMHAYAKKHEFEQAAVVRNMIFSLEHLKDVSLLDNDIVERSRESSQSRTYPFRIEAYDIAHISGSHTVGVMTVVENGMPKKSEYRKFKIKSAEGVNDSMHLKEVLRRRLAHHEWRRPDIILMDGGEIQKRAGQSVVKELGFAIPVLSIVKDDRHKAKAILGNKELAEQHKRSLVLANTEAHRFAVTYHRSLRDKIV